MYMYRLRWCWRPSLTGRGHPSPLSTILGAAPVGASPRVAFGTLLRPQTKILPTPLDFTRVMCQQFEKNRDISLCTSPECPADWRHKNQVALPNDHNFFKYFSMIRQYLSIRPDRKAGDPTVVDLRCLKYLPSAEIHWKLGYTDNWNLQLPSRRSSHHQKSTDLDSSWSRCIIRPWKLCSTSSRISIVSRASHLSRLSCVLWQFHSLIKHVQSSWANTIWAFVTIWLVSMSSDRPSLG